MEIFNKFKIFEYHQIQKFSIIADYREQDFYVNQLCVYKAGAVTYFLFNFEHNLSQRRTFHVWGEHKIKVYDAEKICC